jgi:hypothetical protein
MGNPSFFKEFLKDAQQASAGCGFLVSVILAQWADETAYGGTLSSHDTWNFAGLTGNVYGAVGTTSNGLAIYASEAAGLNAYIECANQSIYDKVRAASNSTDQAVALGQSPWAGAKYDAADYLAGRPLANPGIDLITIISANNLTQYDAGSVDSSSPTQKSGSSATSSSGPQTTSESTVSVQTQFQQAFQPIPFPAPGLGSDVSLDSFIIDGESLSLNVSGAVVTPQLDLSLTKSSTVTLTIADPDRIIINSIVFQQASLLSFTTPTGIYPFQMVSLEKAGSVLTITFEAWVVAALRTATGAFTAAPGTITRTGFAQMLVQGIDGAGFNFAPDSYLSTLNDRYIHTTKEQLSRGTSDLPLEDSWTCLQRLASEIQWVCFESFGIVYFGPYSYLTSLPPKFEPIEFTDGVQDIDGTYDVGQPLGDLTVNCVADSWTPLIGDCVKIKNLGAFNGNWIVSEMERDDMLEPDIQITLTQPLPGLPEPSSGGASAAAKGGGKSQTAGGSSAAQKALASAESQIGVPYVWGGETPGVGFDCSGLVQWAYGTAGVSIPRTTTTQWPSSAGAPVPPGIKNLQPGDLVYFAGSDPPPPGHVAMVVSTDLATNTVKVIDAYETGVPVRYDTFTYVNPGGDTSFAGTYYGALRPAQ